MKLLKKLLPVTALASAVAIATPLVTSCSQGVVASASTYDYEPTIKPREGGNIDYKDKTKVKEIAKDYFSDPKHFAEDFCFMKVKSYAALKKELEGKYKDVTVNFSVVVKNVSFTEKTIQYQLPGASAKTDVTGYVANYDLLYSRYFTYTLENPESETAKYKKYKYTVETQETDSVRNAFLFWHGMKSKNTKPTVWGCFDDAASEDWQWRDSETYYELQEWTYDDDTVVVDQENSSANDYYSKKVMPTPTYQIELFNDTQYYYNYVDTLVPTGEVDVEIGSNYLSNFTITNI